MVILWIISIIALAQGLITLVFGISNMKYCIRYKSRPASKGSVLVFCPVKGVIPGLEGNARSLLQQNHPDYRVMFIVESREDPAWPILSRIDGAELFVSGQTIDCGQKVHNLASAVQACAHSVDFLVLWSFPRQHC